MAKKIFEVLREYDLLEDVLGQTGDNASSNDTTLDHLERLFKELRKPVLTGRHTQIRCFAHILNLVVKVCVLCVFVSAQYS